MELRSRQLHRYAGLDYVLKCYDWSIFNLGNTGALDLECWNTWVTGDMEVFCFSLTRPAFILLNSFTTLMTFNSPMFLSELKPDPRSYSTKKKSGITIPL